MSEYLQTPNIIELIKHYVTRTVSFAILLLVAFLFLMPVLFVLLGIFLVFCAFIGWFMKGEWSNFRGRVYGTDGYSLTWSLETDDEYYSILATESAKAALNAIFDENIEKIRNTFNDKKNMAALNLGGGIGIVRHSDNQCIIFHEHLMEDQCDQLLKQHRRLVLDARDKRVFVVRK